MATYCAIGCPQQQHWMEGYLIPFRASLFFSEIHGLGII